MRPTTRGRVRDRLSGLGATLLIAAFVIGMPPLLFAIDAKPWHESLGDIGSLLTNPDDGTLALLVVAVVAWLAWAAMTALFALEVLAFIRGVPAPRLPGLGPLQDQVGNLVAVAALLFVATPAIAPAFAPQAAHAAPETPQQIVIPTATPLAETATAATPVVTSGPDEATTLDYTVRRGDSLWKIAQEQLGDPMRFHEIVSLNPDALRGRADFIDPGMVLRLPSDAAPTREETEDAPQPEETYVVESGDTLWEIADEKLGSGERYPEIFEASRDTVQ
ncbi:MAG: LysM peptidoglycan-binding domain-containing protein, partial [Nocardioides sp.]